MTSVPETSQSIGPFIEAPSASLPPNLRHIEPIIYADIFDYPLTLEEIVELRQRRKQSSLEIWKRARQGRELRFHGLHHRRLIRKALERRVDRLSSLLSVQRATG